MKKNYKPKMARFSAARKAQKTYRRSLCFFEFFSFTIENEWQTQNFPPASAQHFWVSRFFLAFPLRKFLVFANVRYHKMFPF